MSSKIPICQNSSIFENFFDFVVLNAVEIRGQNSKKSSKIKDIETAHAW